MIEDLLFQHLDMPVPLWRVELPTQQALCHCPLVLPEFQFCFSYKGLIIVKSEMQFSSTNLDIWTTMEQ